jgi:hypothetical protein
MCDSKVLRTTCHVTAGSIVGIGESQEVNVAGFEAALDTIRDERTLTLTEPFDCANIPILANASRRLAADKDGDDTLKQIRAADESQPNKMQDPVDPFRSFAGMSMFRSLRRSGMPLCGTIDMPFECTREFPTTCDHTETQHRPLVESANTLQTNDVYDVYLVKDDTLLLNFSATVAAKSCNVVTDPDGGSAVYIRVGGLERRLSSFHNQSTVTVIGDLFSAAKQPLRGQIDIAREDQTVWTTLDLRSDISKGDIFGVQLPGIDQVWESVVVKQSKNTIFTAEPFPGNALAGYSGALAYRRQAQSGRVLGSARVINERTFPSTHTLLLLMGTGDEDDIALTDVAEEEDAEMEVEDEEDAHTEMAASLHEENLANAKAICYEWMHEQYKRVVRLVGYTRLTVADIKPDKIVLASSYCGDAFDSVKLYRGLTPKKIPKIKFPTGHNATVQIDGSVSVGNGSFTAVTTRDVCPVLIPGDRVRIADQVCMVEGCKPVSGSGLWC